MRERLYIFLKLVLFWMGYMVVARLMFMVYNYDFTNQLTWSEAGLSLLYGLRMDASLSGYFLALSGLLLTLSVFNNNLWISRTITVVNLVLLYVISIIVTVDLELYQHWGFRMNTTPLLYVGSEAMGSVAPRIIFQLIAIYAGLTSASAYVFMRKINPHIRYVGEAKAKESIVLLLVTALMFIPIRGSFTVAPMNSGFVYFHNSKPYANHAAINVVWNFMYNLRGSSRTTYAENFFDAAKTNTMFSSLYEAGDSTVQLLSNPKPNVILVILESFTADVIGPLGGRKDITPNLNKLCEEGVLFTNFYSSGDRTDKGLIGILSGYPAQPQTSIIKFPAKTQKLPQLNQHMRQLGYRTSFIYGGDIDFANFRSYLNTSGFHNITTLDDFDSELYTSKWGIHDHFMFERAKQELDTTRETFFKVILTLSSHEPFDVPMQTVFPGTDEESLFLNSCYYADQSLASFVAYCKQQSWWKNTVMILTADHGHRHPGNKALQDKERFRIPLLMIGGAVAKDTVIHTLGGQTDIPNTLLGQIAKPSGEFMFSKNIMDTRAKPFAAYFFNDGYGFLLPGKYMVYDNPGQQFLKQENVNQEDLDLSKAYQQKLYTNYNNIDKK